MIHDYKVEKLIFSTTPASLTYMAMIYGENDFPLGSGNRFSLMNIDSKKTIYDLHSNRIENMFWENFCEAKSRFFGIDDDRVEVLEIFDPFKFKTVYLINDKRIPRNWLLETEYDHLLEIESNVEYITFFPDEGASGIWIKRNDKFGLKKAHKDELPFALSIKSLNMIRAMQIVWDNFLPNNEKEASEYDLSLRQQPDLFDIDLMEHMIVINVKKENPKYAHIIQYSNGNRFDKTQGIIV